MSQSKMLHLVRPGAKEQSSNDHYPTPPLATYALLDQALKRNVEVPHTIWEPAAGRGWMSWELKRSGRDVYSSDLVKYDDPLVHVNQGDFLEAGRIGSMAGVVTNPPYARNLAEKFIRRTLEDLEYTYCAALCRLTFAESERRRELFSKVLPPTEVMVFSSRFSCDERYFVSNPLGGMVAYAWWVWDYRLGKTHETKMSWIDTKDMYKKWLASMNGESIKQYVRTDAAV